MSLEAAQAVCQGLFNKLFFKLFIGQAADGFEVFTGVRLSDADVAVIEGEIRANLG